jgi:hypothetical protein
LEQTRTLHGKEINCLSCKYNNDNICTIFELLGETNKPIPKHIINKGCAYYLEEGVKEHPLLRVAIKMFNCKLTK